MDHKRHATLTKVSWRELLYWLYRDRSMMTMPEAEEGDRERR